MTNPLKIKKLWMTVILAAILIGVAGVRADPFVGKWKPDRIQIDDSIATIEITDSGIIHSESNGYGPMTFHDTEYTSGSLPKTYIDKYPQVTYSIALFVCLDDTTPDNLYLRVGRMPHPSDNTIYWSRIKEGQYYTHSGSDVAHPIYWNYENSVTVDYDGHVTWYWD